MGQLHKPYLTEPLKYQVMEIVLEVPDKDAARVLELIRGIKRVKVKSPKKVKRPASEMRKDLEEALSDVKKYQRGEIELKSWDELYAELKAESASEGNSESDALIPEHKAGPKMPHAL